MSESVRILDIVQRVGQAGMTGDVVGELQALLEAMEWAIENPVVARRIGFEMAGAKLREVELRKMLEVGQMDAKQ